MVLKRGRKKSEGGKKKKRKEREEGRGLFEALALSCLSR